MPRRTPTRNPEPTRERRTATVLLKLTPTELRQLTVKAKRRRVARAVLIRTAALAA